MQPVFSATLLHFRNQSSKLGPYVNAKTLLTLTLLQAREAAMSFFRPSLNQHGLTEQQWRVIRILRQQRDGELPVGQPGLHPAPEHDRRAGAPGARRHRPALEGAQDQRRVYVNLTEKGQQCFVSMSGDMEKNYQRIQERFGEEKLAQLLELLNELKKIKP